MNWHPPQCFGPYWCEQSRFQPILGLEGPKCFCLGQFGHGLCLAGPGQPPRRPYRQRRRRDRPHMPGPLIWVWVRPPTHMRFARTKKTSEHNGGRHVLQHQTVCHSAKGWKATGKNNSKKQGQPGQDLDHRLQQPHPLYGPSSNAGKNVPCGPPLSEKWAGGPNKHKAPPHTPLQCACCCQHIPPASGHGLEACQRGGWRGICRCAVRITAQAF